jgi:hypothetical protein
MARMLVALLVAAGAASVVAQQEATGDYAVDLARVYGGYQRLLALKEACDAVVPETRAANDEAFAAWEARHRSLVQELQRRVAALIRRASRDEKEYARNVGKYEGAILRERHEYRDLLIGLGPEELRPQCRRMPERLNAPESDLAQAYAAELKTIRARKP